SQPIPSVLIQQAEKLKQSVAQYSDERMLIELERLMFYLGDGHSYVLPFAARIVQSNFLPLHFYLFSDGMFIINAEEPYRKLVGYKVKQVASVMPQKFMNDMEGFISQDNVMGAKWIGPFFLRFRGMLECYGLAKDASFVKLILEDDKGRQQTQEVSFIPVPQLRGIPKLVASQLSDAPLPPLYLSNIQKNVWLKELPEENALYVQFNQVMDDADQTLSAFSNILKNKLQERKPGILIIDVRHNNGGNGELTGPIISVLRYFSKSETSRKLVIITGRNTFSAAQIFISLAAREATVLFAGEPSSSSPNFVGEENEFELSWSGARGSISNRYHENIPGDKRKWIEPDIKVELSSKDYFANHDPVLSEIFKRL
ncbi:MAG TPA: hypothetical protein VFD56_03175, partial [Chitinophagaceae bacterium]|nr:hypothetical protein [Chitinophagaceae bacterium]